LAHCGERAGADAERLELAPLAVAVDGDVWTIRRGEQTVEAAPSDVRTFADLIHECRTALGLVIAGRVEGDPAAMAAFCAWDPVLRSVLDGRGVYRPGDVTLCASDGSTLELDPRFDIGDQPAEAAHFLAEAGFLAQNVFTEDELDAVDADLARAVEAARPGDGLTWWATTGRGERYPCRILDFARASPACAPCWSTPGSSPSVSSSATVTGRATPSVSTSPRWRRRPWSNGSTRSKAWPACRGTRTVSGAATPSSVRDSPWASA